MEDKSVEDVCDWLEEKGFLEDLLEAFWGKAWKSVIITHVNGPILYSDEDMKDDAVAVGLSSSPGPDWLKDLVPKVGLRLKVHKALRSLYLQCQMT